MADKNKDKSTNKYQDYLDELQNVAMPGERTNATAAYKEEMDRVRRDAAIEKGIQGLGQIAAGIAGKQSLKDKDSYGQNIQNLDFGESLIPGQTAAITEQYKARQAELDKLEDNKRQSILDRMGIEKTASEEGRADKALNLRERAIAVQEAQQNFKKGLDDPKSPASKSMREFLTEVTGKDFSNQSAAQMKPLYNKALDYMSNQQKQEAAAQKELKKPTEAEKVIDREFGKEYNSYQNKGGKSKATHALKSLNTSLTALNSDNDNISGPVVGSLHDEIRKRTYPESWKTEQNVKKIIMESLKPILGSQFTENEGKRLLSYTYDVALEEDVNADNLKKLINQLHQAKADKEEAIAYYNEHRTLRGFEGKGQWSVDDFMQDDAPADPKRKRLEELRRKAGK